MLANLYHSLYRVVERVTIAIRRMGYRLIREHVVLIHTPKCGGTYLNYQYEIHTRANITPVGHARYPAKLISSKATVVGLIREPADWYASYFYFCRRALSEAPQGDKNFPEQHPIALFSENATLSLPEMLGNMADPAYLDNICGQQLTANIYGRNLEDVFEFMRRTGTGFWTWTMMYHFSKKETSEMRTRNDVLRNAEEIIGRVAFIHQEALDKEVGEILNLPISSGKRRNVSRRPSRMISSELRKIVALLDGDLASIFGC